MTDPTPQNTPTRDEAPDALAKQVTAAASDMCEIARIANEWRNGPKQSLTAIREIRAVLAPAPASGRVDAMDKPCPFCGGTNTIQGGDDKVCGIFCKDCGAAGPNGYQSQLQWNDRASLSPAATPVSEAEPVAPGDFVNVDGEDGPLEIIRIDYVLATSPMLPNGGAQVSTLTVDADLCRPVRALAKPASSPAGGDVEDRHAIKALMKAIRRAEDGAGTLPAKEAVKLRPADWHAVCDRARKLAALSQSTSAGRVGE